MYRMLAVPCASTLCVMNVRTDGAKVEAILPDFIQLKQDMRQSSLQVSFCSFRMAHCRHMLIDRLHVPNGHACTAFSRL